MKKNGEVKTVLEAGTHRFWDLHNKIEAVVYEHAQPEIKGELADYLRDYLPELTEKYCINLELAKDEIALRYDHNILVEVIANNRQYLYWRGALNQRIEIVKLEQNFVLPAAVTDELVKAKAAKQQVAGSGNILISQIPAYHVGILKVESEIIKILTAGAYGFWALMANIEVAVCGLTKQTLEQSLSQCLLTYCPNLVDEYCIRMELNENEVGLRYENDILTEILSPGTSTLYWSGVVEQRLDKLQLKENLQVAGNIVNQLVNPQLRKHIVTGANGVLLATIPTYHVGILKVDGKIHSMLEAGVSGYWSFNRNLSLEVVDTRLQSMEVSGQEILTRDKVNLRINLIANWRYSDILQAYGTLAKPDEHVYRELQFGLREAVGTRTLDELLENKQVIDDVVSQYIAAKLNGYGVEIAGLGVKDIVLPGDMKVILSQVVEAEKSAQANVIRRREETAATRSLLNTAKVMENNPVALRLKEMETLERVAERIDKISVFGGLDQVLNGLVKIQAN